MEIKEQVNFSEFEENVKNNKNITLENNDVPIKIRIKKWLATMITTGIVNFGTKLKWQFGLCLYLVIVCPVGTYTSIKWIFHLFF